MSPLFTTLESVLRTRGHSVTKARKMIFAAFTGSESLSMTELMHKLQGQVDRASIYRGIKLFESLDIIHRLQLGWKYKLELSDMFREHHHHATCAQCGTVVPLHEQPSLEKAIIQLGSTVDFSVTSHSLEVRGLCQQCIRL